MMMICLPTPERKIIAAAGIYHPVFHCIPFILTECKMQRSFLSKLSHAPPMAVLSFSFMGESVEVLMAESFFAVNI
jgi:hypothetical protein